MRVSRGLEGFLVGKMVVRKFAFGCDPVECPPVVGARPIRARYPGARDCGSCEPDA